MSGWHRVTELEAAKLERELARELPLGHFLKGRAVRAHFRRHDRDDVAFSMDGSRFCVVHLTWSVETDARWPRYELVDALPDGD